MICTSYFPASTAASLISLINILIVYLCPHFVLDIKHVGLMRDTAAGTPPVCAPGLCNQSGFGTLQEVINSHDYCVDDHYFKGARQQLVRRGLIEPEHLKEEERRQVCCILSWPICLSPLPLSVSFVKRKGFEHQSSATLPRRQKQLIRDVVKGCKGERHSPRRYKVRAVYHQYRQDGMNYIT